MTIIYYAYCVNYYKLKKRLEYITLNEVNNFSLFMRKNKKLFQFFKFRCNNKDIKGLFMFQYVLDNLYFDNNNIKPKLPETKNIGHGYGIYICVNMFTSFIWNCVDNDNYYSFHPENMIVYKERGYIKLEKYKPNYLHYFSDKRYIKMNEKCYLEKQSIKNTKKGILLISRDNHEYEYPSVILNIKDKYINNILLFYKILYYLQKNNHSEFYRESYFNVLSKLDECDFRVVYYDNENYNNMNVIDTCLPIPKLTKYILQKNIIKLNKITKYKYIKIIYVYQYLLQNYHSNIINGIINKII